MTRAALGLALALLGLPEACAKLGIRPGAKEEPPPAEPPPAPLVSAAPPPVWRPTAPATATTPPGAEDPRDKALERARAAAAAGEHKKVKALLDKRVRAGRASDAEAAVLYGSCTALKDKACLGAVRTKYPAAVTP